MFEKEVKKLEELLKTVKDCNNNELFWIELKTNFIDENQRYSLIGQNIVGISNSCTLYKRNYGYIICGIEDGSLNQVGVQFDPFNLKLGNQDLEVLWRSQMSGVDFEIMPFKKDDKNFLLIEIIKSQGRVATFKKESYLRIGKNLVNLKDCSEEIRMKMYYSIKRAEFWKRSLKENLSPSEILTYLNTDLYYILQKKSIPTNINTVLKDFEDEELVVSESGSYVITYLGALLFSRSFRDFDELNDKRLRVITYKGKSKLDNPIQDMLLSSGYAVIYENSINYIKSQIPEEQIIEGAIRQNKIKYPDRAIRELLSNILIHQDFLESGINPTVEIYEDRIEFINAGECLVDTNRIIDSVPKTRNEKLVDIMRRLNICELRGSGIDRTIIAIQDMQLPAPLFENKSNGFVAKIFSYKPYRDLTEEEKLRACYFHICYSHINGLKATNESLRMVFGLSEKSYATVSRLIKKCIKFQLVKQFDPDNRSNKFTSYVPYWS